VLGTEAIQAAMKILAEMLDAMDIRANRDLGEVAALQLLNHHLA
jgi:hypothetical protein